MGGKLRKFNAIILIICMILTACESVESNNARLYGASAHPRAGQWSGARCGLDRGLDCYSEIDCIGCQNIRCKAPADEAWRLVWRNCSEVTGERGGVCKPTKP